MNEELKNDLFHILRTRNHDLITDNANLYVALLKSENKYIEQERYVQYLETILNELGWNPNKEHTC